MAIPSKAIGGGNVSTAMNVFRLSFSQNLSSAPQFQMWDNGSTFPAVDAAGATTTKEAFVGTAGNSNKPEYALVSTTSAASTSTWLPGTATGGSANPNRMKGTTNYVTDPTTPTLITAPSTAPTAVAGAAGNPNGVYRYAVTFVNGTTQNLGETGAGTSETGTTTLTSQQGSLTSVPVGPAGTTKRNIYRTLAAGGVGTEKFVGTIADNSTTTFTDNIADGSLGANIPTVNTTAAVRFNMTAEFASDSAVPSSSSQNILLQVQYQYTGSAPTLTYSYNDGGSDAAPTWTNFVPGTNGVRFVNTGTIAGTYKYTLPSSSTANVQELWVTT